MNQRCLSLGAIWVTTMFKFFFRWVYWWKLGRKSKKFFKEELMLARHREPLEFNEESKQVVIEDWLKAGHDIRVPNFGGGRIETGI